MSSYPHRTPTSASSNRGFQRIEDSNSHSFDEEMEGIPLENVNTNASFGIRRNGLGTESPNNQKPNPTEPQTEKHRGLFHSVSRKAGRRKIKSLSEDDRVGSGPPRLTGLGKFYKKVVGFSPVIRHIVYIIPIGLLLAIPIVVGVTIAKDAYIGGVRLVWFFTWIETVWLSIWVAKLVAQLLPSVVLFVMGVVSSGTRKYAQIIRALEIPLSLVMWAAVSLITFRVLTLAPGNASPTQAWVGIMLNVLAPLLIAAAIYLGEKFVIQLISVSYHRRSFQGRIKESKRAVHLVALLYEASRSLFPMYCREFEDEDILINDSIEALLFANKKRHRRSGSQTPMALIAGVGRLGDKLTSAFGNMASEISGKQVFNPNSAHSVVVEALEKKRSSEALAKRIWMSFVIEDKEALYLDDLIEVLGPTHQEEAEEAFAALDVDSNGDISLDEMIMRVVEIGRDRKAIANSMHDVGQAIAVLDQIFVSVITVIVVFIIVAFQNTNFVTTLATAGTTLLSLSFVFAVTTQEFLGSCIFLFVKHPYDCGDRVTINNDDLVVENISLLYSVFKRVNSMKMVQIPNIVLNGLWIENVSRSKAMKEQLHMFIDFGTTIEDIELLRVEMEAFVRHPDNARDFQPDLILETSGIGNMDKLELIVEIRHKSNWSNEAVRAARRSKFMCALVLALRKVPIRPPGGGGPALGDPKNPAYSVAVTDGFAVEAREAHKSDEEAKRLVPTQKAVDASKVDKAAMSFGKSSGVDLGLEVKASEALNHRAAADDGLDWDSSTREPSLEHVRSEEPTEVEELRQGLLHRQSTRGRRRPGLSTRIPPAAHLSTIIDAGSEMKLDGVMPPKGPSRAMNGLDEEAGIEGRVEEYDGRAYGGVNRVGFDTTANTEYSPAGRFAAAAGHLQSQQHQQHSQYSGGRLP